MRKRKCFVILCLLIFTLLLVSACGGGQEKAGNQMGNDVGAEAGNEGDELEPIVLKLSSAWAPPEAAVTARTTKLWQDMVTEASGGKITFENHYGGALGGGPDQLDLASGGAVDLVLTYGWLTKDKMPLWNFPYTMPFSTMDAEIVVEATQRVMDEFTEFEEELERNNLIHIFTTPNTRYTFACIEPIRSISDFRGKTIAAVGAEFPRYVKAVGAEIVSAPKEERFTMLQTGVIDVSLDPIESMQENDQCSQAPYLVDAKILVANANSIFMNKDKFNSLPKEYQDILIETANEMKGKIGALVNGYTDEIVKEFEAEIPDFEYIEISDEEILEWAEMMDDVAYEWATDMEKRYGYPAHDIVRRYIEINRELGYEYPREWGTGN